MTCNKFITCPIFELRAYLTLCGGMHMTLEEKLKQILDYIEGEESKPVDNHNYETRLWSKGYRKGMDIIKNLILAVLNKDD